MNNLNVELDVIQNYGEKIINTSNLQEGKLYYINRFNNTSRRTSPVMKKDYIAKYINGELKPIYYRFSKLYSPIPGINYTLPWLPLSKDIYDYDDIDDIMEYIANGRGDTVYCNDDGIFNRGTTVIHLKDMETVITEDFSPDEAHDQYKEIKSIIKNEIGKDLKIAPDGTVFDNKIDGLVSRHISSYL